MVNRVGVEHDLEFWGGSRILDAFGNELAVAGKGEKQSAWWTSWAYPNLYAPDSPRINTRVLATAALATI